LHIVIDVVTETSPDFQIDPRRLYKGGMLAKKRGHVVSTRVLAAAVPILTGGLEPALGYTTLQYVKLDAHAPPLRAAMTRSPVTSSKKVVGAFGRSPKSNGFWHTDSGLSQKFTLGSI
jgi:hypothetical protein